jgi:hypothetical protein
VTAQVTAPDPVRGPARGPRLLRSWRVAGDLAWLVAIASLAFFATAEYCRQLYVDTYFDLYVGRFVAEHGVPQHNVVTIIAHGQPWVDQQWLGQLAYYRAWQVGGYAAVVMLSIALVSAGVTILGALMLRRGVSPFAMCAWTLAALAVSYGYATPRTQSFGYLFVPTVLWLVLADDGPRWPRARTWLSVPLLVVWANVHGSVLLGAGFVGLHAAWRAVRALHRRDPRGLAGYLLLGASAVVSLICTPYGVGVVRYYASLIGNPVLSRFGGEWSPPNAADAGSWAFFAVVIAIMVAMARAWSRGARPQPELAAFGAVTLGVALLALRNTPWFGFVGCLLAADTLAGRAWETALAASFRRALAATLAAIAVVSAIGLARTPVSQYEARLPRQAIDAAANVAAHNPGLAVLSDQWCSVGLLWLHPAMFGRVAFDVREEQYSQAQLAAILDFMLARGSERNRVLRGYDLVVVSRRWHPSLATAMMRMPGWRVVDAAGSGVVLERVR